MLFFTKKIIITQHAKERYQERVSKENLPFQEIRQRILGDFQVKSIRRKTPKDSEGNFKLWIHGSRLYGCKETDKTIIVKTVIQMLPENEQKIIDEIDKILLTD